MTWLTAYPLDAGTVASHDLWGIALKSGFGDFALDLTCAQFGFHEGATIPWKKYATDRNSPGGRIASAEDHFSSELVEDSSGMSPSEIVTLQRRIVNKRASRDIAPMIETWLLDRRLTAKQMLLAEQEVFDGYLTDILSNVIKGIEKNIKEGRKLSEQQDKKT